MIEFVFESDTQAEHLAELQKSFSAYRNGDREESITFLMDCVDNIMVSAKSFHDRVTAFGLIANGEFSFVVDGLCVMAF